MTTLQIAGDPNALPPSGLADRAYLVAQWHITKTQRELARIESRLWEGREDDVELPRRTWLPRIVGTAMPQRNIELRATLDAAGAAAIPLWERVDNGGSTSIGIHTAARLLREARERALRTKTTLALSVLHGLAEFDAAPMVTRSAGGHVVRRIVREPDAKPLRASTRMPHDAAGRFWSSLREQATEYLIAQFTESNPDADPIVVERLVSEFARDLKVLTDEHQGKIKRAIGSNHGAEIKRARMISACRTLSIDPPKPGKRVDLGLANKRKKMLARAYHPDSGTGATDQYQAVLDAYAVLEQYNEAAR